MGSAALSGVPSRAGGVAGLDAVSLHLVLTALLVVAIVIVGGATRLTESGLSITEWELVTGVLPPLDAAQWQVEFEKYRQIPQYREVHRGMSLSEFQVIYLWEWGHRLLGRVIGLVYLTGFVLLLATRRLDARTAWAMGGIGLLIGLQGAIGWWMVTSGLVERVTVAPYRLATHLTLACVIFAALVTLALSRRPATAPLSAVASSARWRAGFLLALLFAQIFLGGLVAGTRSGYVYQTWPLMDGAVIPDGLFRAGPWWRDLAESTLTSQFVHRLLAYGLLGLALLHGIALAREGAAPRVLWGAWLVFGALLVQAAIGVATLWSGMALPVALSHQAWIMPTLALALWHAHQVRPALARQAAWARA